MPVALHEFVQVIVSFFFLRITKEEAPVYAATSLGSPTQTAFCLNEILNNASHTSRYSDFVNTKPKTD